MFVALVLGGTHILKTALQVMIIMIYFLYHSDWVVSRSKLIEQLGGGVLPYKGTGQVLTIYGRISIVLKDSETVAITY